MIDSNDPPFTPMLVLPQAPALLEARVVELIVHVRAGADVWPGLLAVLNTCTARTGRSSTPGSIHRERVNPCNVNIQIAHGERQDRDGEHIDR